MSFKSSHRIVVASVFCLAILAAGDRVALAQNNSLYGSGPNNSLYSAAPQQQQQAGISLASASWTHQAPEEPRVAKINDLVRVEVTVGSEMQSNGKLDRKKQGFGELSLTKWIKFYGMDLGEDKQNYGTPDIRGDVNNKIQAQGDLQTKDKLKFKLACRIVDIRPNGNCVLEGNVTVRNNEETWDYSVMGEVRAIDIKPDNSLTSDACADLKVIKREAGEVRDSYRRGWALQWLDKWQPF